MQDRVPIVVEKKVVACIGCQHCLAICPAGALSILGSSPENCSALKGKLPTAEQVELLMKGRRSIRQYKDEDLEPELIEQLLNVAGHAPTGVNCAQVRFNLIDNKAALAVFREEAYAELARLAERGELPVNRKILGIFAGLWKDKGIDIIFRNTPHLLRQKIRQLFLPNTICVS
jgi:Fe-S-cluster-containing hydrogenase component 2